MIRELLSLAVFNLLQRKLRSFLTLLGIVIGIAAIISLVSIGEGMKLAIGEQLEQLGTNKIMVMPSTSGAGFGPPTGAAEELTEKDLKEIKNLKDVEMAIPLVFKTLPVKYGNTIRTLYVMGIPPKESEKFFSDVQSYEIEDGRFFREDENSAAVIGNLIKKDVFPDEVGLKSKLTIKDMDLKVVGILKPLGNTQDDSSIMTSIETLREISGKPEKITMIMVKVFEDPKDVAERIEEKLEDLHGEKLFMAMTTEQILQQVGRIFGIISLVLGGIAAIALVVAGIGIANTMFMSIMERTREIGIMKAIGATNQIVLLVFLMESVLIALIGGVIGCVVGIIMSKIISSASVITGMQLTTTVTPQLLAIGLLFSLGVGTVSGFLPARRASKLQPVEALRYE